MSQQPGKPGQPGEPSEGRTGGAGGMGGTGGAGDTTGGAGGAGGTGGASGQNASEKRRSYWMARGVIPRWQLVVVYALIVGAGLAGFVELEAQQDDNRKLAEAIQQQRVDSILQGCREQNRRHNQTVRRLERFAAEFPDEAQSEDFGVDETIALIDALVPLRNCDRRVDQLTEPTGAP